MLLFCIEDDQAKPTRLISPSPPRQARGPPISVQVRLPGASSPQGPTTGTAIGRRHGRGRRWRGGPGLLVLALRRGLQVPERLARAQLLARRRQPGPLGQRREQLVAEAPDLLHRRGGDRAQVRVLVPGLLELLPQAVALGPELTHGPRQALDQIACGPEV